jgi:hypothetical protein
MIPMYFIHSDSGDSHRSLKEHLFFLVQPYDVTPKRMLYSFTDYFCLTLLCSHSSSSSRSGRLPGVLASVNR